MGKHHIRQQQKHGRRRGIPNAKYELDVYRCPFCHYWHVGHTNRGI